MIFRRTVVMVSRRSPIGLRISQNHILRPTASTSGYAYSTNANRNDTDGTDKKGNHDSNEGTTTTGKDNLETNGNYKMTWENPPSYQNALTTIQTLSRSHLEKLQRDMQPLIHRVQNASSTIKRFSSDVTDSKDALRRASMALNELTGYNHIELVKKKVTDQAATFELTRDQVQIAKKRYELAIATRSSTQRGINELLQRKHLWTGDDVTQFTELYRLEHEHAKEEEMAKEHYQQKEKQMDREYMALARSIMERYHDEQLWSDKIRSVSTYGTWALMVLNLMLFVAVQTIFEPRKRKRLTDRFEELLVDKVAEQETKFTEVADTMAQTDQVLMQQQQMLVDLMTQMKEGSSTTTTNADMDLEASNLQPEQQTAIGTPPVIITDNTYGYSTQTDSQPSSGFESSDDNMYGQDKHTLVIGDNNELTQSPDSSIVLSQRSLIIYSLESALAGGLITGLAMFLWK